MPVAALAGIAPLCPLDWRVVFPSAAAAVIVVVVLVVVVVVVHVLVGVFCSFRNAFGYVLPEGCAFGERVF